MGWGIGNIGGGTSLNFTVKAYATEAALLAATPKENTIGIITTTAINGWIFSAVEPTEPVEGIVWISTGTSSAIEFNALKKNAIQVYPISAKQYVGGAWINVTVKSYQDGGWKTTSMVLLGKSGFDSIFSKFDSINESLTTLTISDDYFTMTCRHSGSNACHLYCGFEDLYDVTDCKTLIVNLKEVSFPGTYGTMPRVYLSKTRGQQDTAVAEKRFANDSTRVELDVSSLTGEYYVNFYNLAPVYCETWSFTVDLVEFVG